MHINQLTLTTRCHDALLAAGIDTVENLLALNWEELQEITNVGEKSLAEIVWEALALHQRQPDAYEKAARYDAIARICGDAIEATGQ